MPGTRYDAGTKAKAIRLVREHAGDYPTQWAAIRAVSGRLGMSAETLRKWIRQAQVDEGKAAGVTSAESAEIRELRRKTASWSRPWKFSGRRRVFSRGSATRDTADLCVHRCAEGHLRGRTDLSGTGRSRRADRPAHLLGASRGGAV